MEDTKKFKIAKKNYDRFWEKMNNLYDGEEETNMMHASYLHQKDGGFIIDYHWSDEKISPTALIQWINSYNKKTVKRDEWVTKIELPSELIERLSDMYEEFEPPVEIKGVTISERVTTS